MIYLIGNDQLPNDFTNNQLLISNKEYQKIINLKGIEGVVLSVLPDYRGIGIGKMLIDVSYKIAKMANIDYIWGSHRDILNNLAEWKSRRNHIATIGENHYTYRLI